jgi:hypothetical protein
MISLLNNDAKSAFIAVTTLKLSRTNYSQNTQLTNAVFTVEGWLQNEGKLSILNMPSSNQTVRNAVAFISTWIKDNECPDRR